MITMNGVNRDKTKVPDEFFPVMFRLSVLLLNSTSKLIHNRCTCKPLQLHKCMQMNNKLRVLFCYLLIVASFVQVSPLQFLSQHLPLIDIAFC